MGFSDAKKKAKLLLACLALVCVSRSREGDAPFPSCDDKRTKSYGESGPEGQPL